MNLGIYIWTFIGVWGFLACFFLLQYIEKRMQKRLFGSSYEARPYRCPSPKHFVWATICGLAGPLMWAVALFIFLVRAPDMYVEQWDAFWAWYRRPLCQPKRKNAE